MAGKTTTQRREHFDQLVEQAEKKFLTSPKAYRRKLRFLAFIGYAYISFILFFTLALTGLTIFGAIKSSAFLILLIKKKLIIVLLAVLYILTKALWVRIESPIGYRLDRKKYKGLYREIEQMARQLKTPKIHEILLTEDYNAAISQTPRLGILGSYKNVLILGLPLLLCQSKAQVYAIVAHELGHLSGNHSRFSGWIYRVRITWMNIMECFDRTGGWAYIIFGKFFDWYAPYFNAYSFALSRANEYEADAIAVQLTSKKDFTESLILTHVIPELLYQQYWSKIEKKIGDTEHIIDDAFNGLYRSARALNFDTKHVQPLLSKAVKQVTANTDTHPALQDRIKPYSETVEEPVWPEQCAAEVLFESKLPGILNDFDEHWAGTNQGWWQERYEYLNQSKNELKKLEQKQELNDEELWDLAIWTQELKPETDSLPLFQSFVQRNPDHSDGNFNIGKLMLERDDQEGVYYLEKAKNNREYVIPACEALYFFYKDQGQDELAQQHLLEAEQFMDLRDQAQEERTFISRKDSFTTDDLSDEWLAYLSEQFSKLDYIKAAWVCKKDVKVFSDIPIYLILYSKSWWKSEAKINQMIVDKLDFPAEYFVASRNGDFYSIAKKVIDMQQVARKIY